MSDIIQIILNKLYGNTKKLISTSKKSYSQLGEDMIVRFLFEIIKIPNPSYLDIGAYHPFIFSNTAYFYENGSVGINIEPNPELFNEFINFRKRDLNLNIGISDHNGILNYYLMSSPTLNTFCEDEAKRMENEESQKIIGIIKIPVISINNLLDSYLNNIWPDFLSLDVEGLDEIIIHKLNEKGQKPKVICIETISYSSHGIGVKNHTLIKYLEDIGYFLFADTYVNSIFILKDLWINR